MLLETVDILRGLIAIRQRKPLCASVYVRECLCACVCSFAYVWICIIKSILQLQDGYRMQCVNHISIYLLLCIIIALRF